MSAAADQPQVLNAPAVTPGWGIEDMAEPERGRQRGDQAGRPSKSARANAPLSRSEIEILRVICDARHSVFVSVHANGRRRYGYWRPLDSATGKGGCYVALPTAECDQLYEVGRIALGEPVTDPSRTTYRVRPVPAAGPPARVPAPPAPAAAPAPVRSVRAVRAGVRAA
ncbi:MULTISPECIES: hypothetical protein [Streptomyces]|uniref:Uncharacterized protein n=2 Tax=Streptomyces TaxID=1883 RepID=A0ABV9IYM9_9ACTN